jgi:hypothetical protein
MTGTQPSPPDEHLARRLREIDPARGLPSLAEHRIEEIMSSTTAHEPSEDTRPSRPADVSRRRLRTGIVAGLAAAAAAAAIITAAVVGQPSPGSTLSLSLPEDTGLGALCAPIEPQFIAGSEVAFEGRVTGIEGSSVTLEVLHQYTGEATSTVVIPQGTDGLSELTVEPMEVGGTYLISATDGVVATCGSSGRSTPELKAVYEAAFP